VLGTGGYVCRYVSCKTKQTGFSKKQDLFECLYVKVSLAGIVHTNTFWKEVICFFDLRFEQARIHFAPSNQNFFGL
jgi:hypothetical protein